MKNDIVKEAEHILHDSEKYVKEAWYDIFNQPLSVWAISFACIISFMGLGMVDPLLGSIARNLKASPSQVSLLFTAYTLVMSVAVLFTNYISSRFGAKNCMLVGISLVSIFAILSGIATNIQEIVLARMFWGLGNALFLVTALSTMIRLAKSKMNKAIILYESSIGFGLAIGPLLGGVLGAISWRIAFYTVGSMMLIAFISVAFLMPKLAKPDIKPKITAPFTALKYPGLLTFSGFAFLYNFGFFALIGFTPIVLDHIGFQMQHLAWIFFGWGVCLGVSSILIGPAISKVLKTITILRWGITWLAMIYAASALFNTNLVILSFLTIVSGIFMGIINAALTTAILHSSPVERGTATASYSFIRFMGGAISPFICGFIYEIYGASTVYLIVSIVLLLAYYLLVETHKYTRKKY